MTHSPAIQEHRATLGWPPKELSPNKRGHWAKAHKPRQQYKSDCYYTAKDQGLGKIDAGRLRVNIILTPPDKRRRDDDNMIGAFKYGRDAIAELIGVDDANWETSYAFLPPKKPGKIEITIKEA